MCYGCYEDYGKPKIVNPNVIKTAKSIQSLYQYAPVGGNLHVVVDDWNLEDENIDSCIGYDSPIEYTPRQIQHQDLLAKKLMTLSEDERATALAMADGFIDYQGKDMEE